jgi:hypothetical protein
MNYNDLVGFIGIFITLFAYFLATVALIKKDGKLFYVMNAVGAALACYASILINYWPFVILEGTWTLISVYGLMRVMRIRLN